MKNKSIKFLIYLILGGFLFKLFKLVFKRKNKKRLEVNFKHLVKDEKKEIKELISGKESFKRFCCDSGSIMKDYFIPHDKNEYKPKILHKKSLTIIVVALLALKLSVAGYLFCIYPNCAKMSVMISSEILEMINLERGENNILRLSRNSKLDAVALRKAEDMINNDYFAHKSPDGKMIWDMIDRKEYPYLYVGENLAMNFTSADSAHKALMRSVTHKRNILNEQYTEIGLAVVSGVINGRNTNVLVELFARPSVVKSVSPLSTDKKIKKLPAPSATVKEYETIVEPEKNLAIVDTKILGESDQFNKTVELFVDDEVNEFLIQETKQTGITAKIIKTSYYIFSFVLILIILSLIVNMLVKFSIQHKSAIIQGMLVIIFIVSLMYVKLHHLEYVIDKIFIV